jgi:hypothetical protein
MAEPKTIVISDVHMTTSPYQGILNVMLNKIAQKDEEVTELVPQLSNRSPGLYR